MDNAEIYALNLTFVTNNGEQLAQILDGDDLNVDVWGWMKLPEDSSYGPGCYYIWFNTSILTISEPTFYYIIPLIYSSVYRPAIIRPYVWIVPVESQITPLQNANEMTPFDELQLYLDQSTRIYLKINVTQEESSLFQFSVLDAEVYYAIYHENDYISGGQIAQDENGLYSFVMNATTIGYYTVHFYGLKANYLISQSSIVFIVLEKLS